LNFEAQQRDTSVVDGNATVEDETKRISVEALQHSKGNIFIPKYYGILSERLLL
jgi:hypothetical protein